MSPARTEPLGVLTAWSEPVSQGQAVIPAPEPDVVALTRAIDAEVQSLAEILGVGEGDPLDAPFCTIELACEAIRQLYRIS